MTIKDFFAPFRNRQDMQTGQTAAHTLRADLDRLAAQLERMRNRMDAKDVGNPADIQPMSMQSERKILEGNIHQIYADMGKVRGLLVPHGDALLPHSMIVPLATYSPWQADHKFLNVYAKVVGFTLVDQYRLWELWKLAESVSKLDGDVIEIGVWRGGSAALMYRQLCDQGSDCAIHLCDTFSGVVKTGDKDTAYTDGAHSDTSVPVVQSLLDTVKQSGDKVRPQIHVGIFPEDTGHSFANSKFKLVHIDVDVYQSARDCVEFVSSRLCVGGIIVFDDYGFQGCEGVTKLGNELSTLKNFVSIHNLNGHFILIKIAP
jgi:O-methyltransferase